MVNTERNYEKLGEIQKMPDGKIIVKEYRTAFDKAIAEGKSVHNLMLVIRALQAKSPRCPCNPYDEIKTYKGWQTWGKEQGLSKCHVRRGEKALVKLTSFASGINEDGSRYSYPKSAAVFCACQVDMEFE